MGVVAIFTEAPPAPPSCPASANAGTEVYGPISNLDCAINEDPWREDPPGLTSGTTASLTVPYSEINHPGGTNWYDFDITLQAHPTNDLVVENFIMSHRNMAGAVYEFDGGPVVQVPLFTITAGVDYVISSASFYMYLTRDLIFEISYTDNQGGDWVPMSTNLVANHYVYTVSPIPVTYTELVNDSGKRGIVNKIVEV